MVSRKKSGPFIAYNNQRNYYGAVDALLLSQHREALDSDGRACLDYHKVMPGSRDCEIELPDFRNVWSTGIGQQGAYAIHEGFIGGWERARTARNVVRGVSTVHSVPRGGDWRLPTTTDGSLEGEIVAEDASGTASDVSFGARVFRLKKFMSHPTKVPYELELDGDAFPGQIGEALSDQVARIQNRTWTSRLTAEATSVSAQSATAIAWLDLVGLIGAVGDAYLSQETSVFMMSRETLVYLLKLQSGQAAPEFRFENGRLQGYRVIVNGHLSTTITSGDKTILFGDFSRFHIAETPLQLQIARETFAETDDILYRAVQRADAGIANTSDVPIAVLTQ